MHVLDPIPQPAPLHLYVGDDNDGNNQLPPVAGVPVPEGEPQQLQQQQLQQQNNNPGPRGSPVIQQEENVGNPAPQNNFLLSVAGVHITHQVICNSETLKCMRVSSK